MTTDVASFFLSLSFIIQYIAKNEPQSKGNLINPRNKQLEFIYSN